MNFLENFAGCIFCDVSYFAISWFVIIGVIAIIGFILSLLLIWRVYKKIDLTKNQAKLLSLSYSMIASTVIVYGLLASNENIDLYGVVPVALTLLLSTGGYLVLRHFGYSKKSLLTFLTSGITSYLVYSLIAYPTDRPLIAIFISILILFVLIIKLINQRRSQ